MLSSDTSLFVAFHLHHSNIRSRQNAVRFTHNQKPVRFTFLQDGGYLQKSLRITFNPPTWLSISLSCAENPDKFPNSLSIGDNMPDAKLLRCFGPYSLHVIVFFL